MIFKYKLLGPVDQVKTETVEADKLEQAEKKLYELGYNLHYGGWLILNLDIKRGGE